jgi:ABC-type nitrate/sulfonate/bicarbonate transport system substrate-binding protein
MMSSMRTTTLILMVALVSLSSCGGGVEKRPLRVGLIRPSLDYLPFVLATELGGLDASGFAVTEFASGWEANEALAAGKVDVAILPFTYVWADAAAGLPVRTVSFLERESDGIAARRPASSLADLAGRRIGVLRASTLDVLAGAALADAGVTAELVPLRGPAELVAALRGGDVDAVSLYVPPLLGLGDDFPVVHWFADADPLHPCCDIAANRDALRDRGDQVTAFVALLERGVALLAQRPQEAAAVAAARWQLAPATASAALAHMQFRTGLEATGRDFERRMGAAMLARGYLTRAVTTDEVYAH